MLEGKYLIEEHHGDANEQAEKDSGDQPDRENGYHAAEEQDEGRDDERRATDERRNAPPKHTHAAVRRTAEDHGEGHAADNQAPAIQPGERVGDDEAEHQTGGEAPEVKREQGSGWPRRPQVGRARSEQHRPAA